MTGPVDPPRDPDRFDPAEEPRGRTLPELLGAGAYEDKRDNATWLWGLLGILAFLGIISLVISLL